VDNTIPKRIENLGKLVQEAESLDEARFAITGSGLKKPGRIAVFPNHEYYIGASTSPEHIVVTKVTDDTIHYRKYPYDRELRVERWIGEDLIAQGTATWLRSGYVKYQPERAKRLRAVMAGKKTQTVDWRKLKKEIEGEPW
jgi:hypothetical protein